MKRKLQLEDMDWVVVGDALEKNFPVDDKDGVASKSNWYRRTLPERYKKILSIIYPEQQERNISNDNIGGLVYIVILRKESKDMAAWLRYLGSSSVLGTTKEMEEGTGAIKKEINFYNKKCIHKVDLLDKKVNKLKNCIYKLERLSNTKSRNRAEECKKEEETKILKSRESKLTQQLKEISPKDVEALKIQLKDFFIIDKRYAKQETKDKITKEDISRRKTKLRELCTSLKCRLCYMLITRYWAREIEDSLGIMESQIREDFESGRFFIAKDTDYFSNVYSAEDPESGIVVEVKIKKSHISK